MTLIDEWQEFFETHSHTISEAHDELKKIEKGEKPRQVEAIDEWLQARELNEDELMTIAALAMQNAIEGAVGLGRLDAVGPTIALSMFQFGFETAAKRYAKDPR